MAGSTRGGGGCSMCRVWLRALKWLPVFIIFLITLWSYYAYVIQLCFMTVSSVLEQAAYLVPYHVLFIMYIWSYVQTIFTDIAPVPEKFKIPANEMDKLLAAESEDAQRMILEHFAADLPIVTRAEKGLFPSLLGKTWGPNLFPWESEPWTMSGAVRYCNRCALVKPDRAHHCSMCGTCVLKMDHHCPWVNNCVCFHNYKFFILFLGYALAYCLFIMCTSMKYFIGFWRIIKVDKVCGKYELQVRHNCYKAFHTYLEGYVQSAGSFQKDGAGNITINAGRYHIVFVFFVALMFGISLASLFGYHCYLVLHNRTTLESFRAPMFRSGSDKNGFSIGIFNNFKEVFGRDPKLWLIPVFTSCGDGCEYPVRSEHRRQVFPALETRCYDAMGTTRSSAGEGVSYPERRPEEDAESLLSSERGWDRERGDRLDSSSFDDSF